MKRLAIFLSFFLSISIVATQSAFAARIYNFLPVPVTAKAAGPIQLRNTLEVRIQPGEVSPSLNWSHSIWVTVEAHEVTCHIKFAGQRAEIVGGNYMTIGVQGNKIVCTLCGSGKNIMAQQTYNNWPAWKPSQTGC